MAIDKLYTMVVDPTSVSIEYNDTSDQIISFVVPSGYTVSSRTIYNSGSGWLTVSSIDMNANKLHFAVSQNNSSSSRSATIVLNGTSTNGRKLTASVPVIQGAVGNPVITIDETSIRAEFDSTEKYYIGCTYNNVDISTVGWKVQYLGTESEWLYQFDWNDTDTKTELEFKVTQSQSTEIRRAYLYIYGYSPLGVYKEISCIVIQDGIPMPEITVDDSEVINGVAFDETGKLYLQFQYDNVLISSVNYTITYDTTDSWIYSTEWDDTDYKREFEFKVSKNTGAIPRVADIVFTANGVYGGTTSAVVRVVQACNIDVYNIPIWKDTFYTSEIDEEYMDYIIKNASGDVIYSGRAYYIDGSININVSEICKDYLSSVANFKTDGLGKVPEYNSLFYIYKVLEDESIQLLMFYHFYDSWYYKDIALLDSKATSKRFVSLNKPIKTSLPSGALVPISLFAGYYAKASDADEYTLTVKEYYEDDPEDTLTYTVKGYGKYDMFNDGSVYKLFDPQAVKVDVITTGLSYTFDNCDANYVLYYKNELGGYDAFGCNGKVLKTDNITRNTITKYSRNTEREFELFNYSNSIVSKWSLVSGRLTDYQSLLMHHLIGSTEVYLHIIDEDVIIPVVITDTTVEYKTFKNQGRKMPFYTINVEASQSKTRQ